MRQHDKSNWSISFNATSSFVISQLLTLHMIYPYRVHVNLVYCFLVILSMITHTFFSIFFFNDTATTDIYTLSLHDAFPFFFKEHAPHQHSPFSLPGRLPV